MSMDTIHFCLLSMDPPHLLYYLMMNGSPLHILSPKINTRVSLRLNIFYKLE